MNNKNVGPLLSVMSDLVMADTDKTDVPDDFFTFALARSLKPLCLRAWVQREELSVRIESGTNSKGLTNKSLGPNGLHPKC